MGEEINWYPAHMKVRYDEWVENILWDWCISKLIFFPPFNIGLISKRTTHDNASSFILISDWGIHYKTVSPSTIKVSQASFLDLVDKGHCLKDIIPS